MEHSLKNTEEDDLENCRSSPTAIVLEVSLFSKFLNEGDESPRKGPPEPISFSGKRIATITQSRRHLGIKGRSCLNTLQFVLSCIGYSVGLGNIWRFPYLCYVHGGGSFLVAYSVMLFFVGFPLFFLEVSLGQYSAKTPIVLFEDLCPLLSGIGPAVLLITALVVVYYNILLAWTILYAFVSFSKQLPWQVCEPNFASKDCYTPSQDGDCKVMNLTFWNMSCYSLTNLCQVVGYPLTNYTRCLNYSRNGSAEDQETAIANVEKRISASEDYFKHHILEMSSSIDEVGPIQWQLALCLFLAWFFVFLSLVRSTYATGKLVYFIALCSCLILIILLVRCVLLEGAIDGIWFFVTPHLSSLTNIKLWEDATVQVLFSLGTSFGILISLSRFSKFKNNCIRDSVVVVACDALTSFLAGFVTFSVIGYLASRFSVSIENVIQSEQNLAFVAYPEALSTLPVAPLWSVLFFSILFCIGLDIQSTAVESILTSIQDGWPILKNHRIQLLSCICCICFFVGLPMTTKAGIFIFSLFDKYSTNWSIVIVGFLECVIVTWIYGTNGEATHNFRNHIAEMTGFRVSLFWIVCWKYITPSLLLVVLFSQCALQTPEQSSDYELMSWAVWLRWILSCAPIAVVPIIGVYKLVKAKWNKRDFKSVLHSTKEWGPAYDSADSLHSFASLRFRDSGCPRESNETSICHQR